MQEDSYEIRAEGQDKPWQSKRNLIKTIAEVLDFNFKYTSMKGIPARPIKITLDGSFPEDELHKVEGIVRLYNEGHLL
ncbi:MAG: hypothetical protein M1165_00110 [Candidatus Pacearchaeota archaeon]|nr:hypothetical protein [Candidatus Pacearchaeota archaeon]